MKGLTGYIHINNGSEHAHSLTKSVEPLIHAFFIFQYKMLLDETSETNTKVDKRRNGRNLHIIWLGCALIGCLSVIMLATEDRADDDTEWYYIDLSRTNDVCIDSDSDSDIHVPVVTTSSIYTIIVDNE